MKDQLTLDVHLRADKRFDNFVSGANKQLLEHLTQAKQSERGFYIWGTEGLGKSHLLHALGVWHQENFEAPVAILPLKEDIFPPESLQGLEVCQLVCIDDLDSVVGHEEWEQALFHLINRLIDNDRLLLVSSSEPLSRLAVKTPDLKSRLGNLVNYELRPLDDEERTQALALRALEKGIKLEQEVLNYISLRGPRDMSLLMTSLKKLEEASLKEKRLVTKPFVKEVLAW
jgi:DnaA family protein